MLTDPLTACVSSVGPVEALEGSITAFSSDRQHCLWINPLWNLLGSRRSQWALEVPKASNLSHRALVPGCGAKSRVRKRTRHPLCSTRGCSTYSATPKWSQRLYLNKSNYSDINQLVKSGGAASSECRSPKRGWRWAFSATTVALIDQYFDTASGSNFILKSS